MSNIGTFLQFILKLHPPSHLARLTIYNYLKNNKLSGEPLSKSVFEEFFFQTLNQQHWRENAEILGNIITADLNTFLQEGHSLSFQLEELKKPQDFQTVTISHLSDLKKILSKHATCSENFDGGRFQLIESNNSSLLMIHLNENGEIRCQKFQPVVWVDGSQLRPLPPVTELLYSAAMELKEEHTHKLQLSPFVSAQFKLVAGQLSGFQIEGFTFQKTGTYLQTLAQNPELFYPIKMIEKHFIKPSSDPFYEELTHILEKCHDLLDSRHPDAVKISSEALKRGRMSLKNIFPNDKLLQLLVSNLEFKIRGGDRPVQLKTEESQKTCQNSPHLSPLGSINL